MFVKINLVHQVSLKQEQKYINKIIQRRKPMALRLVTALEGLYSYRVGDL